MTTQASPTPAAPEARKRREAYIYADGTSGEMKPGCQGVTFDVPSADGKSVETINVLFDSLPEEIRYGLMAFGLNTALTNAINSAARDGNSHERFHDRLAGFKSGEWSARGGERGPREPAKPALILRAIHEAFSKGKVPAKGYADWDEWLDAHHAKWPNVDKKIKLAFAKKWLAFKEINSAYIRIKAEEEKAKAPKATAKLDAKALDDLSF